ncbi:hypothetical protein GCM10020358_69570 [Amorphoplanes nipponensis]
MQSVETLTAWTPGKPVVASSAAVKIYHNVNAGTARTSTTRCTTPPNATTNDTFPLRPCGPPNGSYTVPQAGTRLRLNGPGRQVLVAGYDVTGPAPGSTPPPRSRPTPRSAPAACSPCTAADAEDGETGPAVRPTAPPSP